MANTRKDHKALLAAFGIEEQLVMVNVPNKVAKRMRSKNKKTAPKHHWDMLRMFHPKRFINLMQKIKGK